LKPIIFLLLVFFIQFLDAGEIELKIATYNVESLFDLEKKGYKYKEYKPYEKSMWNQRNYNIKLNNIAKVITDINADIIALQEIHSLKALKDLKLKLKQKGLYYKYYKLADKKDSVIKVAILSKYPFLYSKEITVGISYKYRNIQETKFKIKDQEFYLFNNHWKSKSGPESMRIFSAKRLRDRIDNIGYNKNIILLGDFNSNYNEDITFIRSRKHNNTNNKTGINDVLRTKEQKNRAKDTTYVEKNFYNLWYDTNKQNRYSYIFKGEKETPDNIIISQSLLNKKGMHYKCGSISNFVKDYMLYRGKYPYRWKVSGGKNQVHKGEGYSDHLPVTAKFIIN